MGIHKHYLTFDLSFLKTLYSLDVRSLAVASRSRQAET